MILSGVFVLCDTKYVVVRYYMKFYQSCPTWDNSCQYILMILKQYKQVNARLFEITGCRGNTDLSRYLITAINIEAYFTAVRFSLS